MVAEFLVLGPQPWRHPGTVEGSHDSPRPMGRHPHVDDVGRRTPGAGRGGSDTDQENASTTARLMQRSDVEDTLRPLQSLPFVLRVGRLSLSRLVGPTVSGLSGPTP